MITFRLGTFETNSSSTHSMVICTKDQWDKWAAGELFASRYYDGFKTKEEAISILMKDFPEYFDESGEFRSDSDLSYDSLEELISYESEWYDMDSWVGDLECDENEFTTPGGEVIKVICRYGYDC